MAAPLEAYGRLPSMEDVQISPGGSELALVATQGEQRQILVKRLSDLALLGGLNVGKVKLRDLQWADEQHLLITISMTSSAGGVTSHRHEWFTVMAYDVGERKVHPLLADAIDSMNVTQGPPEIRTVDGKTLVYLRGVHFLGETGVTALFSVDLTTYKSKIVQGGTAQSRDWTLDAAGRTVAEEEYDEPAGVWTLWVRNDDGPWSLSRAIKAPLGGPELSGIARDGRSVLVEAQEGDHSELFEVSPASGTWSAPIPDSFDELLHDPETHALAGGMALKGDVLSYSFFNPKQQADWELAVRAFPGEQVSLVSSSTDHRKLAVLVDGPADGPAYAVVDLDSKHANWLGATYPEVTPKDIAEVRPISYKAADGQSISGYLTLPRGKPANNLPLVVMPHGGPAERDTPGFDWWSQAIASRGYAVLRPNFRGSTGFGDAFLEAGFGQWGRKMQTDLSDGVRYLASQGMVDPKRVCIFGGSYGGYAALAGATLDPGVYRCAISLAGPSDLRRMLHWVRAEQASKENATLRYWTEFMGAKNADDPALDTISPADLAAKATIPILLIHGKDDTVVPFEQSQIMADALNQAGKSVTLVTLKGEDHWLSRGDTRLQMLTAAVGFLETNNPPN